MEEPHDRKFHRGAWANAIMLWMCIHPTWPECTWVEFTLWGEDEEEALGWDRQWMKLGQKELRRQWDDRDRAERPESKQQPTRCGQKKLPCHGIQGSSNIITALLCQPCLPHTHHREPICCSGITLSRALGHGHKQDKQMTAGPGWSRLKVFLLPGCH